MVQQNTRPKICCCLVPLAVSVFPILIRTYLFIFWLLNLSVHPLSPCSNNYCQEEVQERRVEDPSPRNFTFLCGCWTRLKFLLAGVWVNWVISSFWECICIGCIEIIKPSWCSFSQAAEETISTCHLGAVMLAWTTWILRISHGSFHPHSISYSVFWPQTAIQALCCNKR